MSKEMIFDHICLNIDGEKLWFYSQQSGYIFSIDADTGNVNCLCSVPSNGNIWKFRASLYYNEKIYLLPYKSSEVYVYNIFGDCCQKIKLTVDGESAYITGGIIRDKKIYMYGKMSKIFVLDLEKNSSYVLEIDEKLIGSAKKETSLFWTDSFLYRGKIYIPTIYNGMVVVEKGDTIFYFRLGDCNEKWDPGYIFIDKESIKTLYSDRNKKTYVSEYSISNGLLINSEIIEFQHSWNDLPFHVSKFVNNTWVVFPFESEYLYIINKKMKSIKLKNTYCIHSLVMFEGRIYGIDSENGELIIYDTELEQVLEKKLFFSKNGLKQFDEIAKEKLAKDTGVIIQETTMHSLNLFVKAIV